MTKAGVPTVRNGTSANGVDVMSLRIVSDSGQARVKRRLAFILAADVACYNRLIGNDAEGTVAWLYSAPRGRSEPVPLVTLFTPTA
jgi:hypothetical protein